MITTHKLQLEKIFDQKFYERTRKEYYYEYWVKWKGLLAKEVVWMNAINI